MKNLIPLDNGEHITKDCIFVDQGKEYEIDGAGKILGVKVLGKKSWRGSFNRTHWFRRRNQTQGDLDKLEAARLKRERKAKRKAGIW